MKTIKIFVSSSFHEMGCERDILHRQINALICERLKSEQVQVVFVDLRWGIEDRAATSESARAESIIERCFEAVADCDLFFGILGNKYGSFVPRDTLQKYMGADHTKDHSYTELEILYAEQKFAPQNIFFLLKTPSPADHPAIASLKQYVSEKYAHAYYEKDDGRGSVSPAFLSESVNLCLQAIAGIVPRKMESSYYRRTTVLRDCTALAAAHPFVLLYGAHGSGKTILLRFLSEQYRAEGHAILHLHATQADLDLQVELNRHLGTELTLDMAVSALRKTILAGRHTTILIDGVEETDIKQVYQLYRQLHDLSPDALHVFLTARTQETLDLLSVFDIPTYPLPLLQAEEVTDFISRTAHTYSKTVYDEVVGHIAEVGAHLRSPFALDAFLTKIMTAESQLYQKAAASDAYTDEIIRLLNAEVDAFPQTYDLIREWRLRELDRHIYPQFATFMVELTLEYREPLPLPVAIHVFEQYYHTKWSDVDYYTYKLFLRGIVEENDGMITFVNKSSYAKVLERERTPLAGLQETILAVLTALDLNHRKQIALEMELFPARAAERFGATETLSDFAEAFEEFFLFSVLRERANLPKQMVLRLQKAASPEKLGELLKMLLALPYRSAIPLRRVDILLFMLRTIEPKLSDKQCLSLTADLLQHSAHVGAETVAAPLLAILSKRLMQSEKQAELLATYPTEAANALYGCYQVASALDRDSLSAQSLALLVDHLPTITPVPVWAPRVTQAAMQRGLAGAKALIDKLIARFAPVADMEDLCDLSLYINLTYASYERHLREQNIPALLEVGKRLYDACLRAYRLDSAAERSIYNYSLGLNALALGARVEHDSQAESAHLKEIYTARCMLCRLDPDSDMYLQALINTAQQVIRNHVDIGEDYAQMLETVYGFLSTYAKRGNPRSGWIFTGLFRNLCMEDVAAQFFLGKLSEMKNFLLPILRYNTANATNLQELIHCYLTIYQYYCEKQILPLADGRLILDDIYYCAKQVVTLSPSASTCELFASVYREIFTILLQGAQGNLLFTDPIYKDCKAFVKEISTGDNKLCTDILTLLNLELEILSYIYVQADKGDDPTFRKMCAMMGIDPYQELLQNVERGIAIYHSLDGHKHPISPLSIQALLAGAATVAKRTEDPASKRRAEALLAALQARCNG